MFKIVEFSHLLIYEYFKRHQHSDMIFVDATCGRGNDTIFMAKLLNECGHVYSYDIQKIALEYTQNELNIQNIDNVTLKHQSHEFINEVTIDLVIFNLGYLPNGDKSITTNKETTLKSLKKMITLMELNNEMLVILVIYPGHSEGLEESNLINDYVLSLPSNKYLISKYQNYNRPTSPYIITINKEKKKY